MKNIRKKTYNNFMYVMKQVQNKGYDFCEAEQMTHRIFDQVESCPEGLSVMRLVEMIVAKEDTKMKLNKNTRDMIKIGTVLHDGAFSAKVTNVIPSGKGLCITLQFLDGDLAGRQLYAEPLSTYYGCEIVSG